MWIKVFQMYQLDLEKAEEPEIKMPTVSSWIIEKAKELKKKKSTFASLTTLQPFTV